MTKHLVPLLLGVIAAVASAGEFPVPYDTEPDAQQGPMPAAASAAGFQVPAGFNVQVFASEPAVQNPIAMTWDSRGRLWIAENYTYAEREKRFELALRDRVLILDDSDGDGEADQRRVFTDDVQMLTSLAIGRGGVWLMCPPQLLFVPEADGDDVADGPARVALDGFDVPAENYHTFANGLKWGPDGWLYGRCGASSAGRIGVPGTPLAGRTPIQGGVWRFHPEAERFEVLSHGTTNPWGHDWNEHGELFFINTVIGHLWHVFAGAHFKRPHTQDPNPRVYEMIDMHADHWHWDTGQDWTDSRTATGKHDELGGGHAHSGCMIYQGDLLPAAYRGRLFTINLHGRRINVERLERSASGYVARHEPDLFRTADRWFRGIELGYGPDGGVFVLDWADVGECHEHNGVHRQSGRIYKVTSGSPTRRVERNLSALSDRELVDLLADPNQWFVRQARRILVDRAITLGAATTDLLQTRYASADNEVHRLEYLWTLYAVGGTTPGFLRQQLADKDEHIRTWAVRLLTDHWPLDTIMSERPGAPIEIDRATMAALNKLASTDPSGLVRLTLASTLQRLPLAHRGELASALASRIEDADDHNIPLLIWYGLIPVAESSPATLIDVAATAEMPILRKYISRRIAEDTERYPAHISELLERASDGDAHFQSDVIQGLVEGLAGWRKATQPEAWDPFQASLPRAILTDAQSQLRELSVLFGDGLALDEVRQIVLDDEADIQLRRSALETLLTNRPPDLRSICESLLNVRFLNTVAIRGLAGFSDPDIGIHLARNYRRFHHSERPAVIETLVARPEFARALLAALLDDKIPRTALSPFQARQIRSFNDAELTELLSKGWGEIRDSASDKRHQITTLKSELTIEHLDAANMRNGRTVYEKTCANCHRLYGRGGAVGPDLTGSGRHNLDYLLENVVDPSAVVSADYRMSVFALEDGRILNGIVTSPTERTLSIQTAKEEITIGRDEIEEIALSKLSVMPEGLLQPLSGAEIRDLIAYLMHPTQVPLLE